MSEFKIKGIDVSHHNGIINFEKVKNDGIDFVIIRAGYGSGSVDKNFHENMRKAIESGLHIGIYWFSYAYSVKTAILEAQTCYNVIKDYANVIDLPIFFDWENDSYSYAVKQGITPTKIDVSMWANSFLNYIESKNYYVGLYSNVDYLTRFFDTQIQSRFCLWLADWRKNTTFKGYHDFRQFQGDYMVSEKTSVNGIIGNVDKNYMYKDIPAIIKKLGKNNFTKTSENKVNFDVNGDGKINAVDIIHLKNELLK